MQRLWTRWWIIAATGRRNKWQKNCRRFQTSTFCPHQPRSSRPVRLQRPTRSHTAGRPGRRRRRGVDADCWWTLWRDTEECFIVCPVDGGLTQLFNTHVYSCIWALETHAASRNVMRRNSFNYQTNVVWVIYFAYLVSPCYIKYYFNI